MICSIVARPDPSCPLSRKSRSRPVDPQRLRSAARALAPSFGSLVGCSSSSSCWLAIGHPPSPQPDPSGTNLALRCSFCFHPPGKDTRVRALGPLGGRLVAAGDLLPLYDASASVDVLRPAAFVSWGVWVL